jgi:predicted amino acid dehydrogenase
VIAETRGVGLLAAVQLCRPDGEASFLLRFLAARDLLGWVVAGYLLHQHQVRVATTLSEPLTLRIQPSALIPPDALQQFVSALEDVCECLDAQDVTELTRYLASRTPGRVGSPAVWPSGQSAVRFRPHPIRAGAIRRPVAKVAWLFHLIDDHDLRHLEPALADGNRGHRQNLLERLAPLALPILMPSVDVRLRDDQRVRLHPILLPVTSRWLKDKLRARRAAEPRGLVQQGVDVAASLGCHVVALGQYTSVVTQHGRRVAGHGMTVTSGNAYTAVLAVNAIRRARARRGVPAAEMDLAIVGATGNIGRVCAQVLSGDFRSTLLVGNPRRTSHPGLDQLARQLGANASVDLSAVRAADVVLCATSGGGSVLAADQFAPGAMVCDVSVPSALPRSIADDRPDLTTIQAGLVRLPGVEDLSIPGFPLPNGYAYGCLAEGVLLGSDPNPQISFTGSLTIDKLRYIEAVARRQDIDETELPIRDGRGEESHADAT